MKNIPQATELFSPSIVITCNHGYVVKKKKKKWGI